MRQPYRELDSALVLSEVEAVNDLNLQLKSARRSLDREEDLRKAVEAIEAAEKHDRMLTERKA